MSDPVPQSQPPSDPSGPAGDDEIEFELTYPNALDARTLAFAAAFHSSHASGESDLMVGQWEDSFRPEVREWGDWVMVRAVGERVREVRGQCVVVRWEGEGGRKVLFVLEMVVKEEGERAERMRR